MNPCLRTGSKIATCATVGATSSPDSCSTLDSVGPPASTQHSIGVEEAVGKRRNRHGPEGVRADVTNDATPSGRRASSTPTRSKTPSLTGAAQAGPATPAATSTVTSALRRLQSMPIIRPMRWIRRQLSHAVGCTECMQIRGGVHDNVLSRSVLESLATEPRDSHIDRASFGMPRRQCRCEDNTVTRDHDIRRNSRCARVDGSVGVPMDPLNINTSHRWHGRRVTILVCDLPRIVHQIGSFRWTKRRGNAHTRAACLQRPNKAVNTGSKTGKQIACGRAGWKTTHPHRTTQLRHFGTPLYS
jgi:hypothetical protein